ATAALQAFVDGILERMIFDGERLSDLMAPLDLGWKARAQAELALMTDLHPLLTQRAGGRDISGLSAYEQ
ncbi:type I site-specific deoxyribonuclease, HsdR family, partial [mine drainage metagenome]